MSNRDPETPILITDAQRSYEEDLATRKRRYGIMMGMRVPCLVVAAMLYNHPFVAAGLILLSVPLPWMAVIIANDVLPKKATAFRRFRDEPEVATAEPLERRAVESGTNPVIDVTEDPAKT